MKNSKPELIEWVEREVKVSDLKPYERNPRRISKEAFARLVRDIQRNGYHQRIIATPELQVIGGHQRIKVFEKLGITKVKVLTPDRPISHEQFREMLIKDNLPFGEFDIDMLASDYTQEELLEFGMEADWLTELTRDEEGETDPDETPDAPGKPVSVHGDMWILGDHRIRCGSSTDADDVKALLAGAQPMLMVTDPPYGVEYDAAWRDRAGVNKKHQKRATGKVLNDDRADWTEAWALFPGNVAYVWHGGLHSHTVAESLLKSGFLLKGQIIWGKRSLVMGRGNYHWQHEPCWYAVKDGEKHNWFGDRKQTTLWDIENMHRTQGNVDDGKTDHSTQKPVECMKRPIENNSEAGDEIYEPFSGSGTTIIAAQMTGRACLAMELNPAYVDMAVIRWQNFTGEKAVHAESGKEFDTYGKKETKLKATAKKATA